MAVDTKIEVVGVKAALKELNTIDKKLRRQITKDFKEIVAPVVGDAVNLLPFKEPLSGWERGWNAAPGRQKASEGGSRQILPWDDRTFYAAQIKPFTSGKTPKSFKGFTRNATTFGIRWTGPAARLFDQTRGGNTPQGQRMARVLSERFGPASRMIWRAYERSEPQVQDEMKRLVEKIMAAVNRNVRIK